MDEFIDQVARTSAAEVRHDLANHKMVTEIKLDGVMKGFTELRAQLKWAGGLIVMLFLSTLTWSLTQQYSANEAQKKDMQQQLDLLREQERARNASRAEIMSRLPASATQSAGGPLSVGERADLDALRARDGGKN